MTSVESQNIGLPSNNSIYPSGLGYLSSVLKEEKYNVLVKDYALISEEICLNEVRKILEIYNPEVLGISIMSMSRVSAYKVVKIAKEFNPKIKIIAGGMHSSVMYEQLLNNFPIDAVAIGEAEETIKELIPALMKNKDLKKIKGIAFKKNDKMIKTKPRQLIKDIDSFPFPDHQSFMNAERTNACILSSRGCPSNCSYCCLKTISKGVWRQRSYTNVIEEVEFILKNFPQIKQIEFSDDTFTLNEKRVIDFCREIVKRNIKVNFVCSARIIPMSEEMLSNMEKAGFKEIRFGIETGSRKMLELIHKNITPEDIIRTYEICSKFPKIRFVHFLMVGFPQETNETITETIKLIKKIDKLVPTDFFYATPLWVYPGTEVYETMKSKGKIDDSYWLTDKPCPLYTGEHPKAQIIKWSNRISLELCLAKGKLYFIKFMLKKFANNPIYELKKFVNKIV
jgi:radical SAM superfamily enzyme YgiQ (UPF0313 family)